MVKFILILIWALIIFLAAIWKLIFIFRHSFSANIQKDKENPRDKLSDILEPDEAILKQCSWGRQLFPKYCYFTDRRIILTATMGLLTRNYKFIQVSYDAVNTVKVMNKSDQSLETFMGESLPAGALEIKGFGTIWLMNLSGQDLKEIIEYKENLQGQFEVSKWKFMGKGVKNICRKCCKPFEIKATYCSFCQTKITGFGPSIDFSFIWRWWKRYL